MKVRLTYFRDSGKYYSGGEYETTQEHMFQIFDEVREMQRAGRLPGLVDGSHFITLIDSDHPQSYPHLIMKD